MRKYIADIVFGDKSILPGTYIIEIKNCFDKVVVRKIVKI